MKEFKINNISGIEWKIENPQKIVVISHGMAEHAKRYDYFAKKLNEVNIAVYAIDQIGHGNAINNNKGHWEKGDFDKCVDNLYELVKKANTEYPNIPVVLFGHSMGSFITQSYIKKYGKSLNKVIISGSAKTGALHKMGKLMSNLFALGNQKKENKFMNKMSFGSYNNAFKPNRTEFDWLSKDNVQVDKYIQDPLCGFCCTTGFFREFMRGLSKLNKGVKLVPKDLPILLMSGTKDPVGANGKDVKKLNAMYLSFGIKDVTMNLYEDGRHEMLNETNKDDVIKDIIAWINK